MKRRRIRNAVRLLLVGGVGFLFLGRSGIPAEAFNVWFVGSMNRSDLPLYADARYLYWGCVGGFGVSDISDPPTPVLVGGFQLHDWLPPIENGQPLVQTPEGGSKFAYEQSITIGMQVRDGLAYCADEGAGFQIVDVTNPRSPRLRGSYYSGSNYTLGVCVSGRYAYTAGSRSNGTRTVPTLLVIDVGNPSSPTLRGHYDTPGPNYQAYGVSVSGSLACVGDGRLHFVDVTNPSSPFLRSSWGSGGQKPMGIYNVFASNGIAYATETTGTVNSPRDRLLAIDVRNPTTPRLLASTPWATGGAGPVFVCGHYVYASVHSGLYIYDITNPSSLTLRGLYPWWGRIFVRPDPFYRNLVFLGTKILQFPISPAEAHPRWNLYR